jgi:hypothetical protein
MAHVRTSKVTEIIGVNNLNLLFCLRLCRNGHTLDGLRMEVVYKSLVIMPSALAPP